ncbi:uncharacterized protein [Elaeis guineensis]|uniref:Uncharacterized protein LOC105055617 isoform X2 n=1 Tax=Elaeis guineensis var. tenera TaxID=51953 RepID=A0A6I9S9R8_ELAGV|nr:uncharacterized protein LOC105055617 isoform X2 [Elaeis guineensis]
MVVGSGCSLLRKLNLPHLSLFACPARPNSYGSGFLACRFNPRSFFLPFLSSLRQPHIRPATAPPNPPSQPPRLPPPMKGRCLMLHPPHIPKCCQQPRSRRAHHPPLKDCSSSTTTTSTDQGNYEPFLEDGEDMSVFPLFKSNLSWNEDGKRIFLNAGEVPALEVETVTKISSMDSCKNGTSYATWDDGSYLTDRVSTHLSAGPSPSTADKSLFPVAGNMESWLAPGNVVWAKTPSHEWWPAEVMDVRDILDCTSNHHVSHVLVQLYGNHEPAWLDPVKDLSQFDYCFEERSKNPLEAFQDALKQALLNHVHTKSLALLRCSDEVKSTSQNGACDAQNPSNSSRTKDDFIEEGRGKRKRKMKLHFDELSFPEKPQRRVRRLRIMRYLGLIAPAGSPFSSPHVKTS